MPDESLDDYMIGDTVLDVSMVNDIPTPQYPKDYFDALGKDKKPPLTAWFKPDKIDLCRSVVHKGLKTGTGLTTDFVIAYLCHVAENTQCRLAEDWVSFKVTIGKKDDLISVKDLFSCPEAPTPIEITGEENVKLTSADDIWLVHAIFSIWRVGRLNRNAVENYRAEIIQRAVKDQQEIFETYNSFDKKDTKDHQIDISVGCDTFVNWSSQPYITSLAAGFDMFYYKFANEQMARVRFGTIVTRYRDCAALMALGFVTKTLGLANHGEMFEWIFIDCLEEDCKRIGKPGQEVSDTMGYFPYMMDLCKIRKCPYSSSINPGLFDFVHIIGSLKLRARCQRALLHEEVPLSDIITNAELVVYATRKTTSFTKVVQTRRQQQSKVFDQKNAAGSDPNKEPEGDSTLPGLENTGPPMTKKGDVFYLWLQGNGFVVPPEVHVYASICASNMKETNRKGRMGEYLSGHYDSRMRKT